MGATRAADAARQDVQGAPWKLLQVLPILQGPGWTMQILKERVVEKKLVQLVEQHGGVAPKFVVPGDRGWPDRLIITKSGIMFFVETKSPAGGVCSLLQKKIHMILRSLHVNIYTIRKADEIAHRLET